jgi:hypothetical protein
MIGLAQEVASHWQYVIASLSFAASVLALFAGIQSVKKTRVEIHKLHLETEAKEEERRAEQSGVIFESITMDRGNYEWPEVAIADLHIDQKHRLEKASSFLKNVDLSSIRYFQINGLFYF